MQTILLPSLGVGIVFTLITMLMVIGCKAGTIRQNASSVWFMTVHMGYWKTIVLLWAIFATFTAAILGLAQNPA
jgi:hypothetical protein